VAVALVCRKSAKIGQREGLGAMPETRTSDSLRAFASHLAAKPRHRVCPLCAISQEAGCRHDGCRRAPQGAVGIAKKRVWIRPTEQAGLVEYSSFLAARRGAIISLTARHNVPAMYEDASFTRIGGLIAYGPDLTDMFRRAAVYVDRILRGERPADPPVQRPTKFELTINLKTAKALGLTVPPNLLLIADEVIE